jgi:hypothetical protein
MSLRLRQTFTLFPGVRINVGKRGISMSIGVPGATANVSRQGVKATVGAPGTGLSYSTLVVPFGNSEGPSSRHEASGDTFPSPILGSPAAGNSPHSAKIYMPQADMSEISSASVEVLTSLSLKPLHDIVTKGREQLAQVKADLNDAREEEVKQIGELQRRKGSILRWFYKKRIAELESLLPITKSEVARLADWDENTKIVVSFETGDSAQRAYASLVRAFDVLASSEKKWDVTSERATNQFAERTLASRKVDRHLAKIEFSSTDLIQFPGRAMRFENVNGDDILIYPGIAIVPRADGMFALIDIKELDAAAKLVRFEEDESVPTDSQIVGQTWAKTNKDGSQDRRFKENYQIPVCEYGQITFRSQTGIAEEYQVSNARAALSFVGALDAYKKALAEIESPD